MSRSAIPVALLALAALPAQAQVPEPSRRAVPDWTVRTTAEDAAPARPGVGQPTGPLQPRPAIRADAAARAEAEARRKAAARSGRIEWLGPSLDVPDSVPPLGAPPPPPSAGIGPTAERPGTATRPETRIAEPRTIDVRGAAVAIPPGAPAGPLAKPKPGARDPRTGALLKPDTGPVRPAEAAGPVPPGLRGSSDSDPLAEAEDPYAPTGIRAGGFLLYPSLEAGVGRTTNVEGRAGGKHGTVTTVTPELKLRSDWSSHALDIDLRGTYTAYPGRGAYDQPGVNASLKGRIDVTDGTRLDLTAGYTLTREQAGSVETKSLGAGRTGNVATTTASAGITRDVGILFATLRGDVEATRYSLADGDNGTGSGTGTGTGGTGGSAAGLDRSRDNTRVVGAVRVGVNVTPGLKPYVEGQVTRRSYAVAAAGTASTADGHGIRAGVELDSGATLRGDLSAGWSTEEARAPGLKDLSGLTLDGSVTWSPSRLTRVTLNAKTAFEPTTLAGSAGSVARTAGVTVSQSLTRALDAEAGLAVTDRRYVGLDSGERSSTATAALIWKFNPWSQAFLRGQYETFRPTGTEPDYSVGTVTVGVKILR